MKEINVDVLYETELIGVVAILSQSKYIEERNNAKYRNDVFSYFESFLGHKAVLTYRILEERCMFIYDKPLMFILDIKDDKHCSDLLKSYVGDNILHYDSFYKDLVRFEEESNFKEFYINHLSEYKKSVVEFSETVPLKRCVDFLTNVTKEDLKKDLCVNLMFSITSANYGWQTSKKCYCNVRPYNKSKNVGYPCFAYDSIYAETLIVHEFGHSIINPITSKFVDKIKTLSSKNFKECWEYNVYEDKQTVINENIIRAIECLYVKKYHSIDAVAKLINEYYGDGFLYIKAIMNLIEENDKPIEAYFKHIIAIFEK